MKPLSETELREKIDRRMSDVADIAANMNWKDDNSTEEMIRYVGIHRDQLLEIILQDRKAWGEQLLTEAIQVVLKSNSIDVYDNMKKFRERQRNQGEKTDE